MFSILYSGLLVAGLNIPVWKAQHSALGEAQVSAADVQARYGHIPVGVCASNSVLNDKYRDAVGEIARELKDPQDENFEFRLRLWNNGEELRGYAWYHLKFALDPEIKPANRTYHANQFRIKLSTLSNWYGYDLWAYGHMPCPVAD